MVNGGGARCGGSTKNFDETELTSSGETYLVALNPLPLLSLRTTQTNALVVTSGAVRCHFASCTLPLSNDFGIGAASPPEGPPATHGSVFRECRATVSSLRKTEMIPFAHLQHMLHSFASRLAPYCSLSRCQSLPVLLPAGRAHLTRSTVIAPFVPLFSRSRSPLRS